jgi:hypothetical protein
MARKKQRGTCALCLKDKELRRSHLLGRAIYLLNRHGNDDPVMMTPQLIEPTPRQVWRHLLCGDCEQRFSKYGEALIMRLVQRKTDFALLDRLNVARPITPEAKVKAYSGSATGVDTEQLAYFALSVLWRSGVQEWRTLNQQTSGVSLGVCEEPIRKYLAGEAGFPSGVVVTVTICTDIGSRFYTFAPSVRKDTLFVSPSYSLLVRGIWFDILTGVNPSAIVREVCCVNSAKKVLFVKDCEKEILQAGGHIMATAAVSPKLSA